MHVKQALRSRAPVSSWCNTRRMRINAFYRDVLRAPVTNPVWSWGALDPTSNRVFLRVWADLIYRDHNGDECAEVYGDPPIDSLGDPERFAQLAAIRAGAEGFAVVCTPRDPGAVPRKIRSFDREFLLQLGGLTKHGNRRTTYAHVVRRVRVSTVMADTVAQDLADLARKPPDDLTTMQALIAARLGQGRFRTEVLQQWQERCAVTRSATVEVIRASHIKPWRDSTNPERLDPQNGLPLVAKPRRLTRRRPHFV